MYSGSTQVDAATKEKEDEVLCGGGGAHREVDEQLSGLGGDRSEANQ